MASTLDHTQGKPISGENKEVRFCAYCGTKLDKGARFCKGCGKQIAKNSNSINQEENCYDKESEEPITKRQTVYEGYIHKCPNCGEVLESFVIKCPACGYEIRNIKAVSTVREFAQ